MKITGVETTIVKLPNAGFSPPGYRERDALLVEVRTDAGICGWGEGFGFKVNPVTKGLIDTVIAPMIVGKDPTDVEALMLDVQRKSLNYGRGGPFMYGISGVDTALWDIAAKAAGVPLYRLLAGSGPTHASVQAYASLPRYGTPEHVAKFVTKAVEEGYRAIKLHETAVENLRIAREIAGSDLPIMMDTGCPWNLQQAIDIAHAYEPYHAYWIEEPLWPPEDYDTMAKLRSSSPARVAAGENATGSTEFERMIDVGAVDFAQPSVTRCGGITEMRKIFKLADAAGVAVAPHSPYFGPGLLATLHLLAAWPHESVLERYHVDLAASLFGTYLDPVGGRLTLPDGPGLGCDPDPDVIARYRA